MSPQIDFSQWEWEDLVKYLVSQAKNSVTSGDETLLKEALQEVLKGRENRKNFQGPRFAQIPENELRLHLDSEEVVLHDGEPVFGGDHPPRAHRD